MLMGVIHIDARARRLCLFEALLTSHHRLSRSHGGDAAIRMSGASAPAMHVMALY
jgi:hypothetical protein